MKIAELQPKQGNAEVVGKIIEKAEPREFEKFGKSGKVCNAKLQDDSGVITLTLWNEQVDQFQVGDNVKLTNGYVNEWQGEKQLTSGKFGNLEKFEGAVPEEKTAQEIVDESASSDHGEHVVSEDEKTESDVVEADLNQPETESTVTKDEQVEAEIVAGEKQPSPEETVTDDEIIEEDVSVEEEDIE